MIRFAEIVTTFITAIESIVNLNAKLRITLIISHFDLPPTALDRQLLNGVG